MNKFLYLEVFFVLLPHCLWNTHPPGGSDDDVDDDDDSGGTGAEDDSDISLVVTALVMVITGCCFLHILGSDTAIDKLQ
jgi:hypothetical protein